MNSKWFFTVALALTIGSFALNAFLYARLQKKPKVIYQEYQDTIRIQQMESKISSLEQENSKLRERDSLLYEIDQQLKNKMAQNEEVFKKNIDRVRQLNADQSASQLSKNLSESLGYRRRHNSIIP